MKGDVSNVRVFIGVAFSDEVKSYLDVVKNIVMVGSGRGRFAETALFHLTLKFLGEVSEHELSDIRAAMDEVASKNDAFSIRFSHLGQFPSGHRRIIWLGMEKSAPLDRLYGDLEEVLGQVGYAREEKPYVPHITLGRQVSLKRPLQELEVLREIGSPEVPVASITLFHSTRVNDELRYLGIHSSELGLKSLKSREDI